MNILNCNNKPVPEKYYGFIYKTIFPNGKIYIGQSTSKVTFKYFGSGTKVHDFIKHKGVNGIKREILIFCKNKKTLNKFEEFFIKKFDSINTKIGYNIIKGTPFENNPMKNPESVEKLRQYVLLNHPFRGKKFSEEYKKNMSEILKKRKFSGKDNPMFGKKTHNSGKIVINNGVRNKYINKTDYIPQGFKLGMK